MEPRRNRIRKIICRDAVLLSAGCLYAVFVRLTGLAVPCIFKKITGWECPGCGITRACIALISGHLRESFSYNPFLYFVAPCILYLVIHGDVNYVRKGTYRQNTADTVLTYFLIAAALVFGVVRNVT